MSTTQTRWNVVVSKDTDASLRQFLAASGGGRKGDLSKFVEDSVKQRIFQLTVQDIKQQNASMSTEEIEELVDEALTWARKQNC